MNALDKLLNSSDRKTKTIFLTTMFGLAVFIAVAFTIPFQNQELSERYQKPVTEAAQPPTANLMGSWKLDELSGVSEAADSSGNNRRGGYAQSTPFTGFNNNGRLFDGVAFPSELGGVVVDWTFPEPGYSNFTVSAWIKPEFKDSEAPIACTNVRSHKNVPLPQSSNNINYIVGKGMCLFWVPGENKIKFRVTPQEDALVECETDGGVILPDQWGHVAASFDGVSRKMSLYVGGALKKECSIPSAGYIPPNKNGKFYIGFEPEVFGMYGSNGQLRDFRYNQARLTAKAFKGVIDEVRVFNKTVTSTEAIDLQKNGLTPFPCRACRADINRNNAVTMDDYSRLANCFNKSVDTLVNNKPCRDADINGDDVVTILDFSCLATNFNKDGEVIIPERQTDNICKLP